MEDFLCVGSLHGGFGEEFGFEGGAELVVFGLFFRADDVVGGEEAMGDWVLRDARFGFRGARAGGGLGVDLVGVDLGGGCHLGESLDRVVGGGEFEIGFVVHVRSWGQFGTWVEKSGVGSGPDLSGND